MEKAKRSKDITLRDLEHIFLKCLWIMALVAVLATLLTFLFLRQTHRDRYTAQTSLFAMRATASGQSTETADVSISIYLVNDIILNVKSDWVLDRVREETNVRYTNEQLAKMISIEHESGLQTFFIQVTSGSAQEAALIANKVAESLQELFNNTLFQGEQYLRVIDTAKAPEKISNPIKRSRALLAGVAGAVVVYVVAVLVNLLSDRIATADDVKNYLNISVLGEIPNARETKRRRKYGGYYRSEYGRYAHRQEQQETEEKKS